MAHRIPLLLAAAAFVLAAVALAMVMSGAHVAVTPPAPARPSPVGADVVDVDDLTARIDALEQRLGERVSLPGGTARTLASPTEPERADPGHEQRLAMLEAVVARLRADLANLGPMPDTAAGVVAALADKNLYGHDATSEHRQRRRELWRRFLELAPRDAEAPGILERLCNDLIATNARESLAVLDRYQGMVDLPAHHADRLRANCLVQSGQNDEARAVYARLAADLRLDEDDRVAAAFWHAHTWKQQGRYPEARREFEDLIARNVHATLPAISSLVASARGQIAEMDRWQKGR